MYITQSFLVSCIVICCYTCIISVSTLSGLHPYYSYTTIRVGVGDFGFCIGAGAGVDRLLGIFTIGDAVVMGVLLCMTYTLVFDVSLWGGFYGFVFCLNIPNN